jgi:hypothetical protein
MCELAGEECNSAVLISVSHSRVSLATLLCKRHREYRMFYTSPICVLVGGHDRVLLWLVSSSLRVRENR